MSLDFISLDAIKEFAQHYGYWSVWLGIMLENTGLPLPGESIILVAGFLAGSGEMNYWWVLGCAIAGAILGDTFGYWIGRYGGWPLMLQLGKIFRVPEQQLQDIKKRFSHNASRAVFLGRFVVIFRIFAGPMAGIAEMPYRKFLLCNAGGAVVWAGVTVTAAYFGGKAISLEQLASLVGKFGSLVLLALVLWLVAPPLLEHFKGKQPSTPSS
jgi:membrane protein DedA with SNARE-associated domain